MYSVYVSGASAGNCASRRRSSCLRSSNRSVRKSFPSQVSKSNAKKHGGFPRRNSRFLNCGLPRLSREQISPSMTALAFGVRRYLAWQSILTDKESLELTPHQIKQAEEQKETADGVVSSRLPEAYQWLLVP